jgi:(R,R)-butanediol dehydrogenase/meso-butanediol dehydrogenase/diacetyl reductase
MKAARFHGRGDIRVDEVPLPEVRPGTVAVEVEWCGICGTDLHEYIAGPIFIPREPHPYTQCHQNSGSAIPDCVSISRLPWPGWAFQEHGL